MTKELKYPFEEATVRALRVGDMVRVSGRIFTGRDRLHRYLFDGGKCPVDLRDGAVYHCGPVALRSEGRWRIRAAGPTTSMRQDLYMPAIIERHHVRVVIGKGGMGEGTRKACAEFGCVYLQAVGGAAAVLADAIREVEDVHLLKEFGMAEALWVLAVEGMDAVVTMDARGGSLHKRVKAASRRALRGVL